MEVHHHPDVHHKKKRFKEYFLEFLMIFLAVTMGFFSENIREHIIDNGREKDYIKSFFEDLTNDEKQLPILIHSIERQQLQAADSLPLLFNGIEIKKPANPIYVYLRKITRQQGINIFVTDRTIAQLKNSGAMRLIQNKQILDSLVDYYKQVEYVSYLQEILIQQKRLLRESFSPILKGYDYDKVIDSTDKIINTSETLYLKSIDPTAINNCLLCISDVKGLSITVRNLIIKIKNKSGTIKQLMANKYDLEK